MSGRVACKPDFIRNLSLAAAAIATVPVMLVFSLLNTSKALAQSQIADAANSPPLIFEVASIRQDEPGGMLNMVRATFTPDGYSAEHVSLRMLIKNAYGVDDNQISGAPKWIASERYEVEARIDSNTAETLSRLSGDQLKLAHQQMLQALLADRFKLTLHRETKELPVYSLVIAKGGAKIHESKAGDTYANGLKSPSGNIVGPHMALVRLGGGRIAAQGLPLEYLASGLTAQLGRKVLDKTGLAGNYDYTLEWTPDAGRGEVTEFSGPSIFTAIQEQLGLKLESQTAPVEILVIDRVEMPSAN